MISKPWLLGVAASLIVVGLALVVTGRTSDGQNVPQQELLTARPRGALPAQIATPTPDPYPGSTGTPEPVPTQTAITSGVWENWSHEDIADAVAAILETSQIAIVPPTPELETSAVIEPEDGPALGMTEDLVSFQSPQDVALIFSGEFQYTGPASVVPPLAKIYPYVLVVVDTDSGALASYHFNDSLTALETLLP
jgi:hypothetical protein